MLSSPVVAFAAPPFCRLFLNHVQDTRFAVSSLVFGYLDCVISSFDGGYHPWMYGSDSCERCFGTCRTMRNMRELNLLDLRNSIERWFFQETNSNIQVNRPNSNKRMKTTTDIQNLLCEKDFLLLVSEVSKKSLENVITDISGMFPQYFDLNSQLSSITPIRVFETLLYKCNCYECYR